MRFGTRHLKQKDCWRTNTAPANLFFLFIIIVLASCQNNNQIISERDNEADQEVVNAHVHRSDAGHLQLKLDAPLIQKYERPRAKTEYRSKGGERVSMSFFDENDGHIKVNITADSAISFDDRNIMEAHGNVVVIDYGSGDTIYLMDLIWNSNEDRIYSDNPVRARNGNRLTEGDGFTSDERMENLQITHQRGVIEFNE